MWVLSVLSQSPKNGAEIMDQIEIATQGWWRPSPGSVYPLLDELQKEENIKKLEDGKYLITEKGKQEIEWPWGVPKKQPHTIDEVMTELDGYVSYLEDLAKSENSKIVSHSEKIRELNARLQRLAGE